MKNIIVFILLLTTSFVVSQEKYFTKKGIIKFEASVPLFEEIKAKNSVATAILNTDNGEFAALVLMKRFRFKNKLMEEHFNENYVESDDYPKATFKGKLIDFDKNNLKSEYYIKGILTLHGKTKDLTVKATLNKEKNVISISSSFKTKSEDFDIKIPSIMNKKIANNILVFLNFDLQKVL